MSHSVSWNGEYFVLTTDASFAYSQDGVNWTTSSFPNNVNAATPYSVKYLGNKYTITGNIFSNSGQSQIVNIVDGSYVVAIPNNLASGSIIYDVESNIEQPNKIVFPRSIALALGNSYKIAFSVDQGNSWNASDASAVFSVSANDAVWSGNYWVSVGSGAEHTIATSLDGHSWTGRGNYVFSSSCRGIDYSPEQNKFLAIGSSPNILATSSDGIYWLGSNNSLFSSGYDVKWNGSIWVAVGDSSGGNGTIAYSYDGSHWNYAANSFDTSGLSLYYDGTIWTAFGQDSAPYNIAQSSDGISWTFSYSASASKLLFNLPTGQFADPQLNIYPGVPYPLKTVDANIISSVNKYNHNHSDRGIASIQPITIACGEGNATLACSVDGMQWTAIKNNCFSRGNKAVWNGDLWVAVGKRTSASHHWVATSDDGLEWIGRESTILTEAFDVAWNGSLFVAVGYNNNNNNRIATSYDGILWTVSPESVFSTNAQVIKWTGVTWIAYGSGTNTTAISLDGLSWQPTSSRNLCVTDCSNILTGNILSTSSSSQSGTDVPGNAFDGLFNNVITKWSSQSANYSGSGSYIGTESTTYNTNQTATGEWIQVQLSNPAVCQHYYVIFPTGNANSIPSSWKLLGSNDGATWNLLDLFDYGTTSSPPNNSWKYPFVCLPLGVASNTTAYSHYRIVFNTNFGADYVSLAELELFDGGHKVLSRFIQPVILKDCILHPTRLLSVDGVVPNIYRITDLYGNLIKNNHIHGSYANSVLYGLSSEIVTSAFDGLTHIVASSSGELSYLSNAASLTNLNFDNVLNGLPLSSGISRINAACHNRKYFILGGGNGNILYGVLNNNVAPNFYAANANNMFTTVYGLASNSGYGFVVPPNKIHLQENDRLSVITPKYYDSALSPDTSISFNVYASD